MNNNQDGAEPANDAEPIIEKISKILNEESSYDEVVLILNKVSEDGASKKPEMVWNCNFYDAAKLTIAMANELKSMILRDLNIKD